MRATLMNQLHIERCSTKRLTYLIPVSLFSVQTVPSHVDEVLFAAESHVKNQNMQNTFLPRFGSFTNLCYYFTDKAFGFIEKHYGLKF